jgi:hypothetical protein
MRSTWTRITKSAGGKSAVALLVVLASIGSGALVVYAAQGAKPLFAISASPSSRSTKAGGAVSYTVTIARKNNFTGRITLSASRLPTGSTFSVGRTARLGAAKLHRQTTALSIQTKSTAPAGTYKVRLTGTARSGKKVISQTATVTLIVLPSVGSQQTGGTQTGGTQTGGGPTGNTATAGDYTLGATPASQTVPQGSHTTYTVAINDTGGFSGPVSLNVTGLPSGSTAAFNPASPVSGSSTTLTVQTLQSTPTGTYSLTIGGTATINGTTVSRSAGASLVVQTPSGFTISGDLPAALTLGGPAVPLNLSLTNPFDQDLTVSNIVAHVSSVDPSGCVLSNFSVAQMSTSVTVPAHSTRTLDQLSPTDQPKVSWDQKPFAQNACIGATLHFSYTADGTAP